MTNRRQFIRSFLIAGAGVMILPELRHDPAVCGTTSPRWLDHEADDPWAQVPEILRRIKPPVFPKRDFDITRYGALGDGRTSCTEAFRKAIAACNNAGGGRVLVPRGTFLTGAIHLKSNVNLHVSQGATIKYSTNPLEYLPAVFTRFEGTECMNYSPFVYSFEQENIALTGHGTLDGSASDENWWAWARRRPDGSDALARADMTRLKQLAERGVAVAERIFGERHYLRPNFIQPYRSKNVLIEGVRIINSPMWEIHPVLCTNVTIANVNIDSHGPNNDGCDPESCSDVLIKNCDFNTGDDCIAIKSGRNADGRRLHVPSQNIVIQECRMRDGHGGVTIGSEISGGVRNVFAENCRMDSPQLDHGLRVKNNAMRGGLLEDLYFRNIDVGQVAHAAITIDFNYEEGEKGSFTPVVRNFVVKDMKSGRSKYALDVQGFPRAPIYNLRLENCSFDNVAQPNIIRNVEGLTLREVRINGKLVAQPVSAQQIYRWGRGQAKRAPTQP